MKKSVIAVACALSFTTAAHAEDDYKLTPADAGRTPIAQSILNKYSSESRGMDGGVDVETETLVLNAPITVQSCMALAFSAAYGASKASVTCIAPEGELVAVYSCKMVNIDWAYQPRCKREF